MTSETILVRYGFKNTKNNSLSCFFLGGVESKGIYKENKLNEVFVKISKTYGMIL